MIVLFSAFYQIIYTSFFSIQSHSSNFESSSLCV